MNADEIYRRRKALGLSQCKLANALGVSSSAVSRWERGSMTPAPYLAIALEALERRREDALIAQIKADPDYRPMGYMQGRGAA